MGTTYSVVVSHPAEPLELDVIRQGVDSVLVTVNAAMSTYIPDSELSLLNQSSSMDWQPVSKELMTVLEYAQQVGNLTGGAYDATVGPLVNLWGFGPGSQYDNTVPNDEQIASAQARVGHDQLQLRGNPAAAKKLKEDLYVDLSSIAKGFGVDEVGRYLESQGLNEYLVEIGGEVRARGLSPRRDSWRVAVEKPEIGEVSVQRLLQLENISVATSGDYKNYFERDGVRYSHTIDARTGRPVTHRLASVSVAAASALEADAWATALMVLGEDAGYQLAQRLELAAYFIYKSESGFEILETRRFSELFGAEGTTGSS